MMTVYRCQLTTPIGLLGLYGTSQGLAALALPRQAPADIERLLVRRMGGAAFEEGCAVLGLAIEQLTAYFAGQLQVFDLALDIYGTPFQKAAWAAVAAVPYGATCSYADIATSLGQPAATRAVGAANGANPIPIVIPCHRIIGSDGSLTGYGGGLDLKIQLLQLERQNRLVESRRAS